MPDFRRWSRPESHHRAPTKADRRRSIHPSSCHRRAIPSTKLLQEPGMIPAQCREESMHKQSLRSNPSSKDLKSSLLLRSFFYRHFLGNLLRSWLRAGALGRLLHGLGLGCGPCRRSCLCRLRFLAPENIFPTTCVLFTGSNSSNRHRFFSLDMWTVSAERL